MADIRLSYGVTERPQAPLSATCSRAVDVGPAAAEGRPPKSVSIAWRISASPAVDLHRAADPAEHRLMIGAQELKPVLHARLDSAGGDVLDREAGRPRGTSGESRLSAPLNPIRFPQIRSLRARAAP